MICLTENSGYEYGKESSPWNPKFLFFVFFLIDETTFKIANHVVLSINI